MILISAWRIIFSREMKFKSEAEQEMDLYQK